MDNPNVIPHNHSVSQKERIEKRGYEPKVLWFTGLSGSGKSTLANELEKHLFGKGYGTYILDGDNIRKGLNSDLTFSDKDRVENIRRISHVSNLLLDAGIFVLSAFISPFKEDRTKAKNIVGEANFLEVFVDTPLEECERRDVKGLYKKARAGEIKNMTGISAPYEAPDNPDIEIKTENETIEDSVKRIVDYITPKLKLNNE